MSGYLLDTNVPSEIIRLAPEAQVDAWVRSQDDATLHLSVITVGELRKGIALLSVGGRRSRLQTWLEDDLLPVFGDRVLPITQTIAERWGELSASRQLAGRPLGMADGLIAATALEHDLTIVTRNVRDYQELGVNLFSPWNSIK